MVKLSQVLQTNRTKMAMNREYTLCVTVRNTRNLLI